MPPPNQLAYVRTGTGSMKYRPRTPIAILIDTLLAGALFTGVHMVGPESFYAVHVDKLARLKNLPSPKVVLVGGSNLTFGMNTAELERRISMPVANMGLDAGFGVRVMVNAVKGHLKPGDLVLLCIEPPLFNHRLEPNEEFFHLAEVSPESWRYLDHPSAWWALAGRFRTYLNMKGRKFWGLASHGFWKEFHPWQTAEPRYDFAVNPGIGHADPISTTVTERPGTTPFVQMRSNYNDHGDLLAHRPLGPFPPASRSDNCPKKGLSNLAAASFLNQFIQQCADRDITVKMISSPYVRSFYDADPSRISRFDADLRKHVQAEWITDYRDYIFPNSCFFDGPHHLNGRGVEMRVPRLAIDINKYLKSRNQSLAQSRL